ncbi:hypothetical protein MTO96_032428, partial [Rhipicephalus appendiculatus]
MQQVKRNVSFKGFPDDGTEGQTEQAASEPSDRANDSRTSIDEASSSSGGSPRSAEEATSSTPASSWSTLQEAVSSVGAVSLLTCGAASNPTERSAPRCSVALVLAVIFAALFVAVVVIDHGLKLFDVASLGADGKLRPAVTSSTAQNQPNVSVKGVLFATVAPRPNVSKRSVKHLPKTTASDDSTEETSSDVTTSEDDSTEETSSDVTTSE